MLILLVMKPMCGELIDPGHVTTIVKCN